MLNTIPKNKLKKLKLLILDSDGVLVPRGTQITEKESPDKYMVLVIGNRISDGLANKINKLKKKIRICVSSGRAMIYLQGMYDKIIDEKTLLMAENGNILMEGNNIAQLVDYNDYHIKAFLNIRKEIKKLPIDGFEPKQFILTVHCKKEFPEVYTIVKKYDKKDLLKVMWNGEAFDIQAKSASKGTSISVLSGLLSIKTEQMIAIGDRINDADLIKSVGIGVSADINKLKADYFTTSNKLPGEELVDYLLKNL